jgi:ATP-binding cassette subfamily C protein
LVLDEATSALDTAIENAITPVIESLPANSAVMTAARRLATIRNADVVFYLAREKPSAFGTSNEPGVAVPDFATQSGLAGLSEPQD